MPVWQLDHRLLFPDPSMADPDGLLAIGGDMSAERLLLAYSSGIFPWFTQDDEPFWFSPNPRCVLPCNEIKISTSMRRLLNKQAFSVTINHDFQSVITACASIPRKYDSDTWIDAHFIAAYSDLHQKGIAHSVEVWDKEELVGGLYGLTIGACFFGESMFSKVNNASKYGFIRLTQLLEQSGYTFIDCQVHNNHLASLGAKNVHREVFLRMLADALEIEPKTPLHKMVVDAASTKAQNIQLL